MTTAPPHPIRINLRTRQRYANHRRAWELAGMTPTEWYRNVLNAVTLGRDRKLCIGLPGGKRARIRTTDGTGVTVRPTAEEFQRWLAGAEAADLPLKTWIAIVGDFAARGALAAQLRNITIV